MITRMEKTADGTAWNLYVNGTIAVSYETYGVCNAVELALKHPLSGRAYSEGAEIADVIRTTIRRAHESA